MSDKTKIQELEGRIEQLEGWVEEIEKRLDIVGEYMDNNEINHHIDHEK